MTNILFTNVTSTTNVAGVLNNFPYTVVSLSWSDINRDGWPDLWISPHGWVRAANNLRRPIWLSNQGNGTFARMQGVPIVMSSDCDGDTHGHAWADFDNDGDPDLLASTGAKGGTGCSSSILLVNEGNGLIDRAPELNIGYRTGRGRTPFWFDWNNDGLLDLIHNNELRADGTGDPAIFEQTSSHTFRIVPNTGIPRNTESTQMADLFGNNLPDLIFYDHAGPVRFYEQRQTNLVEQTQRFPRFGAQDLAIADFDNNGVADIFAVQGSPSVPSVSETFQNSPKTAFAVLTTKNRTTREIEIKFSNDNPTFDFLNDKKLPVANIFIGSNGLHPTSSRFSLSSSNTNHLGIVPSAQRTTPGLYIGYDASSNSWSAVLSKGGSSTAEVRKLNQIIASLVQKSDPHIRSCDSCREAIVEQSTSGDLTIGLFMESNTDINGLQFINYTPPVNPYAYRPLLLSYDATSGEYVDRTAAAGLDQPINGRQVVPGDFDNDGDIDLYLTSASIYWTLPSIYYQNQGNGTFVQIPTAAGAEVIPRGPGKVDYFDSGALVATADYDRDGFLDLMVTGNTLGLSTPNPSVYQGTLAHLFHNGGNQNKWLQIDLQGVVSNRDGIGAKVYVTANGRTQLREQSGGIHNYSQNFSRLHFGLGDSNIVETIVIQWPSGITQQLNNVPVNQILRIVETSNNEINGTPNNDTLNGTNNPEIINGLAGNDSLVGKGGNDTLNGGSENDLIRGGTGDDKITGDLGRDTLIGGPGRDTFCFNSDSEKIDRIADFNATDDRIQVLGSAFALPVGNLGASMFVIGTTASRFSDRFIYDNNTGRLFFDSDGSGDNLQVQLAILPRLLNLTHDNFVAV